MATKFITFGCWNENCCDISSPVYQVLNKISLEEQDANFSVVLGDNYYPNKVKDKTGEKVKTANIDQLSESFQLLTTSLFGEGAAEAAKRAAKAAEEAIAGVETEGLQASAGVETEGKELFLLLGNHDVEKTQATDNNDSKCYITTFEKVFAYTFNTESTQNRIHFPIPELVMFREFGVNTLIIMIDTNIYTDQYLDCYNSILNKNKLQEELQKEQYRKIQDFLKDKNFKNIIVCGHNPLIGFKNQKIQEKVKSGKKEIKIKGGVDTCNVELYSLLFDVIQPHGIKFYYLCADIHNYQRGVVTITKNGKIMNIEQYIVGIGGAHLDDDYNERYNSRLDSTEPVTNAVIQVGTSVLNYQILEHFSDYGYLVVSINEHDILNFEVKQVTDIGESAGGKHTTRRNKRTKRRNKRTKKTSKRSKRRRYTKHK